MAALELVLITGMSGSGKSVALRALEDAGYYCVDNLPPELLLSFVALEQQASAERVAIAMDVRSATSLPLVPQQLHELRRQQIVLARMGRVVAPPVEAVTIVSKDESARPLGVAPATEGESVERSAQTASNACRNPACTLMFCGRPHGASS